MQRQNNSSSEYQTIDILKSLGTPCSVSYVAKQLGIAWVTARALLLKLALEHKIKSQKTSTGFIFWVNDTCEALS